MKEIPHVRHRGNTLVATLVTVAIILILVVVLFKGSSVFGAAGGKAPSARADGHGTTVLGRVRYEAKDAVCQSNLSQVRTAISLAQQSNDEFPARLEDTKIGNDFYSCPIGHEPYTYNVQTGKVSCPHPGHENY